MSRPIVAALLTASVFATPVTAGSFLRNVEKTIAKAAKDTEAEVNRAKDKITDTAAPAATTIPSVAPTGPPVATPAPVVSKEVAVQQVEALGRKLEQSRTEEAVTKGEKDLATTGFFTLAGALLTALVAMATRGLFDRNDRREKYLAAVEREWQLARQGFDFTTVPKYRRLCRPAAAATLPASKP